MKVRDIMRKDFIWFNSGDSFGHVLSRLAQNNVSSAPVFHEGKFAGVLSASEMVGYFGQKDFSSLWRKNRQTPIEKIKGTIALDFVKKGRILGPEDRLESVLPAIASAHVCVPVVENKKLVGLVRSSDVIKFFLTEVAKDAHKGVSGVPSARRDRGERDAEAGAMDTYIDRLLALVKAEHEITINNAALRLGLPRLTVDRLCNTLSRHHLVKMVYPLFSETKVRMIENDQK